MKISKTFLCVLLSILVFAIYLPSLSNDFVDYDDYKLVTNNSIVTGSVSESIKGAFTSFDPELYIPLTFVSYKIDNLACGLNPFCYHLTNILLHIANSLLVFWLFLIFIKRKSLAFLFALIFALHPINVEAVSWISSRKDVLSAFFFLSSLISYIYARDKESKCIWILSILLFLFGLMSKVSIIVLPLILILFDWHKKRNDLIEKWPYFSLAFIFGLLAIIGKASNIAILPASKTILLVCKNLIFSLKQLIWPTKLSVFYHYANEITLSSKDFYIPIIILMILTAGIISSLKKTKILGLGSAFYVLMLLPAVAAIQKLDGFFFASDRYVYIAQIGIFLAIIYFVSRIFRGLARVPITLVLLLITLAFANLTYKQSMTWKDSTSFFRHSINVNPDLYLPRYYLGRMLQTKGEIEEARKQYEEALKLNESAEEVKEWMEKLDNI